VDQFLLIKIKQLSSNTLQNTISNIALAQGNNGI